MNFADWRNRGPGVEFFDADDCRDLLGTAEKSQRLRSHVLLHEDHADPVQRLLVAFAKDTYIQPHRHSEQWELIIPLQGQLAILSFSDVGQVTNRMLVSAETTPVVQIPRGSWHSLVAVTDTALMIEVKPGPFRPAEFANWSPAEGTAEAAKMRDWLWAAAMGDSTPIF